MASIFTGHKDNENASKLTQDQQKKIQEALLNPPSAHALPKEFWDIPTLKKYVEAKFEVAYESDQSYYFLLKFSNPSFKYPATFDHQMDDAEVAKRIEKIRKKIRPFLNDPPWEVFVLDEVRIELEALQTSHHETVPRSNKNEQGSEVMEFEKTADGFNNTLRIFSSEKQAICHLCCLIGCGFFDGMSICAG